MKVTVGDTWMPLQMNVAPEETVAAVKAKALAVSNTGPSKTADYEVKFGGAVIKDETRSMKSLGIGDDSALIVLSRRRRPVR